MNLKEVLADVDHDSHDWIEETKQDVKNVKINRSAWSKASGYKNEYSYKKVNTQRGKIMYHAHFCFADWSQFDRQTAELENQLKINNLVLDRFGVSLDPSMALPRELRNDDAEHESLYFKEQKDWDHLASVTCSQVHLGDNMIGSPASYDSCKHALEAGITTMGNISQFFGWDYTDFPNVQKRTKSTIQAVLCMAAHKEEGTLIHSNLDDGYGPNTEYVSQLLGMAYLEKYIVEDLCGAKLAPSFGDDFHSPYKRLVMLSALTQMYEGKLVGSMTFANKLGRSRKDITLNNAHLADSLLADMAGQVHYKAGYAVTIMADSGLHSGVTIEETVQKLAFAKELENYVPELLKITDFNKIDEDARIQLKYGKALADAVLEALSSYIDIKNPYEVMLAIKLIGVSNLVNEFGYRGAEEIPTDYNHFEH